MFIPFGFYKAATPPLLLDDYPDATFAFSVRKLNSAYTGNCLKVRRSSDNATLDIGFVGNQIDTASLLTFIGSNDGLVDTWYDQSDNGNNLIQTTNAKQPQIVNAGSVNQSSGKPTIDFGHDSSNPSGLLISPDVTISGEAFTMLYAGSKAKATESYIFSGTNSASRTALISNYSSKDMETFYGPDAADRQTISATGMNTTDTFLVATSRNNPGNIVGRFEGSQVFSVATTGTAGGLNFEDLGTVGTGNDAEMKVGEWIIYPSDKASDLSGMQDNQNTYWNKY